MVDHQDMELLITRSAGGAIIRNAIQGLEKLGYLEKVEKKGRVSF